MERVIKMDEVLKMPGDRYCFKNQTFWMKSEVF